MKSAILFISILLGILFPQMHIYSFLIQYIVMFMLFLSYLDLNLHKTMLKKNILLILIVKDIVALSIYYLLLPFNPQIALIAFLTAVAPTAMSAPAVTKLLHGNVTYITISCMLSNIFIAITLPFYISLLAASQPAASVTAMLTQTLIVIFIPLFLALGVKHYFIKIYSFIKKQKDVTIYALAIVILLTLSKASEFLRVHHEVPFFTLILIAIVSLVICVISFVGGKLAGGKNFSLEASQTLGQKNSAFSVWFALTFFNSLVALGPTFYLIYYATFNAYQIAKSK